MSQLRPYWELIFLLLNRAFFHMKDMHIDICCISMQSNLKNLPPIACNQISCRIMKIDF